MSTGDQSAHTRSRFLVVHDDCVALDERGPFRDVCLALTDRGADVHVAAATGFDAAKTLAQDAESGGGYDAVLVAGRSGAISGIQAGLAPGTLPVGVLPFGDGAMISHALGMRGKPRQVAALLCSSPAVSFPGLLANGSPVHLMTSIGMDADTLAAFSRYVCPAAPRGPVSSSLASNLLRKVERFDAVVDGANYRCCAAFVLRSSGYGASLANGEMTDGLTVVLIEADDRVALFDLTVGAKIGRFLKDKSVNVRTCAQVEIPSGQSLVVEADGRTLADGTATLNSLQLTANPAPLSAIVAVEVADLLGVSGGDMVAA